MGQELLQSMNKQSKGPTVCHMLLVVLRHKANTQTGPLCCVDNILVGEREAINSKQMSTYNVRSW